jgi:hypothetical protein
LSESLREAATQATAGFGGLEEQNERFLGALARQVEEYATTVRTSTVERLDDWNTHTREFSTEMLNATKALSAAVDEVEAKSGAVTFAAELRKGAETLAVAMDDLSARQAAQSAAGDEMLRLAEALRAMVERAEVTLDEDPEDATVAVA